MDFYPSEFPPEARDRIEKAKIRAYRELLPYRVYGFAQQDLAIPCVMRIFLAFATEACALRKELSWTIERVERESNKFLRRLTIRVVFDKFAGLDQHWISHWNGSIAPDVMRRFKDTAEWKEYEELLLTDAVGSIAPADDAAQASTVNPPSRKGGRPRNDDEREAVRKKRDNKKSWKEVANEMNAETGHNKTPDAYRALLKTDSKRAKAPGENVGN